MRTSSRTRSRRPRSRFEVSGGDMRTASIDSVMRRIKVQGILSSKGFALRFQA